MLRHPLSLIAVLALASLCSAQDSKATPWIVYDGFNGPGKGKHIVLVSGDEEYRSEEALPQLGKILAKHHGYKCTVLFAIEKDLIFDKEKKELVKNPKAGEINPQVTDNIPGLESLKTADLMIIATRFRALPEEQMKHIVDYVEAGKPIIGLRTATHAFAGIKGQFAKYNNGGSKDFKGGFGRQVLGEQWVAHHGGHGRESTRGIFAKDAANHPILTGIKDGEIWGGTDVYTANPLPPSTILVYGQVLAGMKATDQPVQGKKNDPMMPIAWTREYKGGRVFATTLGAAEDLVSDGTRRMLVNASFWAVGLESKISATLDIAYVGEYQPTHFSNKGHKKGVFPSQLRIK